MNQRTLVTLSVLEILALVVVLTLYLVAVGRRLRSIATNLGKVAAGVATIEGHVGLVGPTVTQLNGTLEEIVGALPAIASEAGRVAAGRGPSNPRPRPPDPVRTPARNGDGREARQRTPYPRFV
jgi:hypothetical protein